MTSRTCSVPGCDRAHEARGWCKTHYSRWRRTGEIQATSHLSTSDRFWAKVDKTGGVPYQRPDLGACWTWTASVTTDGYGNFWENGRHINAHRWSYRLLVGPIPEGLVLDHLCRVRRCVNPAHLEPVTSGENTRRGNTGALEASRTHCPQGHPYDELNTYRFPDGRRGCRICSRDARRRYAAANREKERAA